MNSPLYVSFTRTIPQKVDYRYFRSNHDVLFEKLRVTVCAISNHTARLESINSEMQFSCENAYKLPNITWFKVAFLFRFFHGVVHVLNIVVFFDFFKKFLHISNLFCRKCLGNLWNTLKSRA